MSAFQFFVKSVNFIDFHISGFKGRLWEMHHCS